MTHAEIIAVFPSLSLSQPMGVYVMIQKYLQAQSLVWVFVVVGILQNIINVLVAALFIYVGDIVIVWAVHVPYHVYSNGMQAKKIIEILTLVQFSGRGHHSLQ